MSVIFALFVCFVPLALLHSAVAHTKNYTKWKFAWLPFATIIFSLSATRVGGSDWQNYEHLYFYMSSAGSWFDAILKNPSFEPGYIVLNYAFYGFADDRRWLIIFESAVNAYAIFLILTRVKGGPIFLIWLFPLQFANILGVRQTLATSIFIVTVTLLQGRLSLIAAFSSGLIHVSSLMLVSGRMLQRFRLTIRSAASILISGVILSAVAGDFFIDKLNNYQENAEDLTDVSGLEIFVGKSLVLFLMFGVGEFARRQLASKEALAHGYEPSTPTGLYFLYFVGIIIAVTLPPLARLLTPLEFLIAWSCCEAIAAVQNPRIRVFLALIIVAVSSAKMLKVWALYGEIYSVCFFCG